MAGPRRVRSTSGWFAVAGGGLGRSFQKHGHRGFLGFKGSGPQGGTPAVKVSLVSPACTARFKGVVDGEAQDDQRLTGAIFGSLSCTARPGQVASAGVCRQPMVALITRH